MSGEDSGNAAAAEETVPPKEQDDAVADTDADTVVADFDPAVWEPTEMRYGLRKLMGIREAMLPIEKPEEIRKLKFLFFPGYGLADDEPEEKQKKEKRSDRNNDRNKDNDKGKGKGKQPQGGRFVPEMGKTELQSGFVRNQWWRNTASNELAVIVREGFSLMSQEIWKVPHGHYVQQAGPAEVFVTGQATGLTRMPVYPRGWVTADASAVGGPKYLEAVRNPRWKVTFKSDTPKGDILVRESVSLESDEVGCILYGSFVYQCGPQETLEDGIIRMPISWSEPEPSNGSTGRRGWVTCDASSQGGPKFFTAVPGGEEDRPPKPPPPAPSASWSSSIKTGGFSPGASASGSAPPPPAAPPAKERKAAGQDGITTWDKNRIWTVMNLDPSNDKSLPLVSRSEPYAPGTGRVPAEDIVVRWLRNDEVVEQIGHSKKTRGYMVMPVKVLKDAEGAEVKDVEGWVTRRPVDKSREATEGAWLIEVRDGEEQVEREKRRSERKEKREGEKNKVEADAE